MRSIVFFVVVLLLGANGYTWYQKSIEQADFEKRETELATARSQLEAKVHNLEAQGDSMRGEIEVLSGSLADTRLSVGKLRKKTGLGQRLQQSYPELAQTDWGVVEVYDDESRRYLEYMVVPLWMSETFIVDHQNASLYSQCLTRR